MTRFDREWVKTRRRRIADTKRDQTVFWEQEAWYKELKDRLTNLLATSEKVSARYHSVPVRSCYEIGKDILKARNEVFKSGQAIGEEGWTGDLGRLMDVLSADLKWGEDELYDCARLAKEFPTWNEFAKKEFEAAERGSLGIFPISGEKLSWNQVKTYVLKTKKRKFKEWCELGGKYNYMCEGKTKVIEIRVCKHHGTDSFLQDLDLFLMKRTD